MKNVTGLIIVAGIATWAAATAPASAAGGGKNIVETAVAAGQFKTLVQAVEAAGLADVLASDGPFTVFAPTDEAFARLPKGVLEGLLKNPDQLKSVLLYHVVAGKAMASDVVTLKTAKTVLGQWVDIDVSQGVRVDDAKVVKTDILASNGVIHVIDSVLLPDNDIIEAARSAGSFATLLAAVEAAGLTDTLRGDGPFTVFAPTDDAFAKLPKGTLEALLKDKKKLASILTYHVVAGKKMAADVVEVESLTTVQGQPVRISKQSGVMVETARILKTDVPATNGVIHVIDTVIMPK